MIVLFFLGVSLMIFFLSTFGLIISPILSIIDSSLNINELANTNLIVRGFGLGVSLLVALIVIKYSSVVLSTIKLHGNQKEGVEIHPTKGKIYAILLILFGIIETIFALYTFIFNGDPLDRSPIIPFYPYLNMIILLIAGFLVSLMMFSRTNYDTKTKSQFTKIVSIIISIIILGLILSILNQIDIINLSEKSMSTLYLLHFYIPLWFVMTYFSFIGSWIGVKYHQSKRGQKMDLPNESIDTSGLNICIYIPAYNAARTLPNLMERIPKNIEGSVNDIIVIDDSSPDNTYLLALGLKTKSNMSNLKIYRTITNQRYGGNQKLGYAYALLKKYDIVIMLHGDAQYAPELIPLILKPFIEGDADMVFGSRFGKSPLKGGMPPVKYVGNKVLTFIENQVLGLNLSEFHSGYRAYSVEALRKIPFLACTNEFHFDTEIIIQMQSAGLKIKEVSIPTYYGEEISNVNKMQYGFDVLRELIVFDLHKRKIINSEKYNIQNLNRLDDEALEQYLNEHLLMI